MRFHNLANSINKKLIFIVLASTLTITSVFANSSKPVTKSEKLTGVWQLKQTSDKNIKKSKSHLLSLISTPESLVVFLEESLDEITINEGFKEFIQTQTLPTNGTIVSTSVQQIGKVFTKAFWQNDKLFVEVETLQGDKITEIFELSANQKQLYVTLQMTENNSAKSYKVKRTYHRVSNTIENDKTESVDLTIYPF